LTQSENLNTGHIHTLHVNRFTENGAYLAALDGNEVLLPKRYWEKSMEKGTFVEVFVYTDSEDRLVATTEHPQALYGEFGVFEVVDISRIGAFVAWGLPKDLFVPKVLQRHPFKKGERVVLRVEKDKRSERLIGTQKIDPYLKNAPKKFFTGKPVELLVYEVTKLGFKVIVQNRFKGLIYHNEVFTPLHVGDVIQTAYVKKVRSDGGLDISLQKIGEGRKTDAAKIVLKRMQENGGSMPYNYKSDAKQIADIFGLSKKVFKSALTQLQDEDQIRVQENGIYLK
jgi:uncharacterized protein